MRRKTAAKRSRIVPPVLPLLAAGLFGYLIGWHATPSKIGASAADKVASRFPDEWNSASPASGAAAASAEAQTSTAAATGSTSIENAQLALFRPQPMVPYAAPAPGPVAQAPGMQVTAAAEAGAPSKAQRSASAAKASIVATQKPGATRPGRMLNDAQIARIKERLNLTPDQEQMWPAVEEALREMAYAKAARRHGTPSNGTQAAEIDANSVEGLKSAATPLIMSFNDEQKQEVRNLVHVMGLDQLASEF